ncbi:MAG TPA: hypothetical protein VLJ38_18610 [Polyangiaceae bacterium]|nr:hypothetical protein [Polyangiaceae bacterium]
MRGITGSARSLPLCVLVGLVWLLAFIHAGPRGDGGEYLLETHALATHGTPDIRVSDAEWLAASEPTYRTFARHLSYGLRRGELVPVAAIRRSERGAYYSLHFWFYSLLAVPALWLSEALGAEPSVALVLVNALAGSIAVVALWLHFERRLFALAAATVFVVTGTALYLGWTGPEALTGAAVVCSCIAASRGKLGVGCLAAALAATQNAAALALVPFVAARCRLRHARPDRQDALLAALALALALLPYAFFYAAFRIPSLLAHFATDPRLISFERAWSFFFDLNQGLLYGMPGVLFACVAAASLALTATKTSARMLIAREVALSVLLVTAMMVPALAVHNWNAGCSVLIRYGYWIALPLLVLALELTQASLGESRRGWFVLGVTLALGFGVMVSNGVTGERYGYLRHTWLAEFVLHHAPGAYNPVPEIFSERTLGAERPPRDPLPVLWPRRGTPMKLLVPEDEPARSERLCPDGGNAASDHVHVASGGWLYLDAPFRCVPSAS